MGNKRYVQKIQEKNTHIIHLFTIVSISAITHNTQDHANLSLYCNAVVSVFCILKQQQQQQH